MGNISKKNAGKNNAESTDNGKSVEEISDIQAYQTTLQNCANLAKKLDTKAAAVFKDADYIAKLGGIMATRYKDTSARYEALKRSIADPTKSKEMQKLQSEGVTIEQIEARFQQFEKQFDILEKTKKVKTEMRDKLQSVEQVDTNPQKTIKPAPSIMSKNMAFSTITMESGKTINVMALSGKTADIKGLNLSEVDIPIADKKTIKLLEWTNQRKILNEAGVEEIVNDTYYLIPEGNMIIQQFSGRKDFPKKDDLQKQLSPFLDVKTGYENFSGDSERKITLFVQSLEANQQKVKSVSIDTEMSPCNSCNEVLDNFTEQYPNTITNYGVRFEHTVDPNKPLPEGDEISNFLKKEHVDITDYLLKN